ncbi:MAG TPA: hypothetical protein DDY71_09895 [Spirochaetia bacterium]|nr:hypothetical protein [Spirochaetia bacterium]
MVVMEVIDILKSERNNFALKKQQKDIAEQIQLSNELKFMLVSVTDKIVNKILIKLITYNVDIC